MVCAVCASCKQEEAQSQGVDERQGWYQRSDTGIVRGERCWRRFGVRFWEEGKGRGVEVGGGRKQIDTNNLVGLEDSFEASEYAAAVAMVYRGIQALKHGEKWRLHKAVRRWKDVRLSRHNGVDIRWPHRFFVEGSRLQQTAYHCYA